MGRNGVGKTTLLRNLVGLEKPNAGIILLNGKEITNTESHFQASAGFGYTPQGRQIFPLLTVEENLLVALSAAGSDQQVIPKAVYDTFPVLEDMRRRRVEIYLVGNSNNWQSPNFGNKTKDITVDIEPTEGIQPNIITMIGEVLRKLVEEDGMTILLVSHHELRQKVC